MTTSTLPEQAFQLEGELILALYLRAEPAMDANIPLGALRTGEFGIGYAVASKADAGSLLTRPRRSAPY